MGPQVGPPERPKLTESPFGLMGKHTIRVAALRTTMTPPFVAPWDHDEAADTVEYAARPATELQARADETLRSVLGRSAAELGVGVDESSETAIQTDVTALLEFADFYRPEDETGWVPRKPALDVTLVDDAGRARWLDSIMDATIEELIQASRAGVLEGDPLRPYLILQVQAGAADLVRDWDQLLAGIELLGRALTAVGGVYGGMVAVKAVVRRLTNGDRALRRRLDEWAGRGGGPTRVRQLFRKREWSTDEAAQLLGCTAQEAEATLHGLGFALDPHQMTWRQSGDLPAQFIVAMLDLISMAQFGSIEREDLPALIDAQIRTFTETGCIEDFDYRAYWQAKYANE
jgi:hypothetical protein